MKIRTRLVIAFLTITLIPIILTTTMGIVLCRHQISSIEKTYGVTDTTWESLSNSMQVLSKVTEKPYEELKKIIAEDPEEMGDATRLEKVNKKLETNIDVVLNSVALNMTYEGSYDEQRSILWDLQLTAKSYYYTPVDSLTRIKESLIEMRSMDFDQKFETYSAEIVPRNAKPTDPHQIIEKVIPGDNDI